MMIEQRPVNQVADLLKFFIPESPRQEQPKETGGMDFQSLLDASLSKIDTQTSQSQNTEAQKDTQANQNQVQIQNPVHNQSDAKFHSYDKPKEGHNFLEQLETILRLPKSKAEQNIDQIPRESSKKFANLDKPQELFPQIKQPESPKLENNLILPEVGLRVKPETTTIKEAPKKSDLEKTEKAEKAEKIKENKLEKLEPNALLHTPEVKQKQSESPNNIKLDKSVTGSAHEQVADKIITLSKALPDSNVQVQDAMNLVKELSQKLGLQKTKSKELELEQGPNKSSQDIKSNRLDRIKLDRLDRLEMPEQSRRVELTSNLKLDSNSIRSHEAGSFSGIQSIRIEKLDSPELKYSTLSPQVVMHHTVSLPSDQSPTIANFAGMLKTQLNGGLNDDIAGQAKIMLDTHGKGEIKLILHPENLGEVKIHLKLDDATVGGTIFVDNKEVLQVFKDNMQELMKAFEAGGLDASQLNLELSNGSGGGEKEDFARRDRESNPSFAKYAVERLGESVPVVRFQDHGSSQVNLIV